MKRKILIVDDSKTVLSILEKNILTMVDDVELLTAYSHKEGLKHILQHSENIHLAILDIHLPDAQDGATIEVATKMGIPTIVLSGTVDNKLKDIIFGKENIIDYISKDGDKGIQSVINSVNRVLKNVNTNVLLVDDSQLHLKAAEKILKKMNLKVTTAADGQEAYDIIQNSHKKFSLVLTDYYMPVMDGMDLTFNLRKKYDKDELSIIVISSNDTPEISAKFLQIGANDYINKPYLETEVKTRINANLDLIDLFQKTKDMANKDFMTGAYNRRFLFESGKAIFSKSTRKHANIVVALLDIDKFKEVNDTYGHDIGDAAIKETVKILKHNLRSSDLLARFGGEEFCILLESISEEDTSKLFEKIRLAFEKHILKINDMNIKFTVSIGVCYGLGNELDDMIKVADDCLYCCKKNGRNQISINNDLLLQD